MLMRAFVCCLSLSFTLFPVDMYASDRAENDGLRITTYNVEWLSKGNIHKRTKFLKGYETQKSIDNNYESAMRNVIAHIIEADPDVLILQEIGDEQTLNEIFKRLNDHKRDMRKTKRLTKNAKNKFVEKGICICKDRLGQNIAIISKIKFLNVKSDFDENFFRPFISGRQLYRKETDDAHTESETGISRGLSVVLQDEHTCYQLYAAHFISEIRGEGSDHQRVAQAEILRRHIRSDLRAGKHVIVAGDFNADVGKPTLQTLRGFRDIDENLLQPAVIFENKQLANYFLIKDQTTRYTHSYERRPGVWIQSQLDHILMSLSLKDIWGKVEVEWHDYLEADDENGKDNHLSQRYRSDHLPFSVTFKEHKKSHSGGNKVCELYTN